MHTVTLIDQHVCHTDARRSSSLSRSRTCVHVNRDDVVDALICGTSWMTGSCRGRSCRDEYVVALTHGGFLDYRNQRSGRKHRDRRKDELKPVQRRISCHKENRNEESKHMAADAENFCNVGIGARKRRSSVSTFRTARFASAGISLKTWCDVTCPSLRIATPSCWTSHNSSHPWFCAR